MIDIHNHILPGLDDGAKNIEETLEIATQLQTAGFHTLIATPHVMEGRDYLNTREIIEATERVQQQVTEAGIAVRILPGAENYIFPNMAKWAGEGKLLTLGNSGKYLLLELPMMEIPRYTEQVFFDLQVKGFIPVLAHPERNRALIDEPERLVDWARKGILFQSNLKSISGKYGSQAQHTAELMIYSGLIHFLGSDVHSVSKSESTYLEALGMIKGIVEGDKFQELAEGNALDVLEGRLPKRDKEYFLKEVPFQKEKRGFWNRFRLFRKGSISIDKF